MYYVSFLKKKTKNSLVQLFKKNSSIFVSRYQNLSKSAHDNKNFTVRHNFNICANAQLSPED